MATITSRPARAIRIQTVARSLALMALALLWATDARAGLDLDLGPATIQEADVPYGTIAQLDTDRAGTWVLRTWPDSSPRDVEMQVSTDTGKTWATRALPDFAYLSFVEVLEADGNWWLSGRIRAGDLFPDGALRVVHSTDAGQTWSKQLFGTPGRETTGGGIVSDGAGTVLLVHSSRNVEEDVPHPEGNVLGLGLLSREGVVRTSTDGGNSWSAPVSPVSEAGNGDHESGLRIAMAPGGVAIAGWTTLSSDQIYADYPRPKRVRFSVSTDHGLSWSASASPHPTIAALSEARLTSLATDGAGTWLMAVNTHDSLGGTIGDDRDNLLLRSTDAGATWSDPVPLNPDAATDDGESWDDRARLLFDGNGNWLAHWGADSRKAGRSWLQMSSSDGGLTWSAPSRGFDDPSRVANSSDFAFDPDGRVLAAWLDRGPVRPNNGSSTRDSTRDVRVARVVDDCPASPAPDCHVADSANRARLRVVADAVSGETSLRWKSKTSFPSADVGDLQQTSLSALCLYDSTAEVDQLALELDLVSGQPCGTRDCWESVRSGSKFKYKDRQGRHGPIRQVLLQPTRALIIRALDTEDRLAPLLPFSQESRVTLQLHNLTTGACWSSSFSVADTTMNTADEFQAKGQ